MANKSKKSKTEKTTKKSSSTNKRKSPNKKKATSVKGCDKVIAEEKPSDVEEKQSNAEEQQSVAEENNQQPQSQQVSQPKPAETPMDFARKISDTFSSYFNHMNRVMTIAISIGLLSSFISGCSIFCGSQSSISSSNSEKRGVSVILQESQTN